MTQLSKPKRGRPADPALQEKRREDLIDAAFELLRHKSYRSITIRDLASEAQTQSAMIKYYFDDKQGLFLALLERISKQQQSNFDEVWQSEQPLKTFIHSSVKFFSANQPVTRLIADEVIAGDSELKKAFIATLPKRTAEMLPKLIAAEQDAGHIRADMNPKWLGFSLINMIITPFVAVPVREQVWHISHEEISSDAWAEHVYRIFTEGAGI
ncbi:TetR/AcrR family transcriptional regulator [Aliamphritea ceti]|uniref:TetR/AcrR family transcriptional regulator n=1 Tax=Aliamphritea ceti TaxID=1524258 RepID=UPI0021C31A52|nr:TetR/AcrR family transcriptional regulator [Aliamphritea ceti]